MNVKGTISRWRVGSPWRGIPLTMSSLDSGGSLRYLLLTPQIFHPTPGLQPKVSQLLLSTLIFLPFSLPAFSCPGTPQSSSVHPWWLWIQHCHCFVPVELVSLGKLPCPCLG